MTSVNDRFYPAEGTVFRPDISRGMFSRVLREYGSPWAGRAGELHDLIVSKRHYPGRWLAVGAVEHELGRNQDSVLGRCDTRSWTNARTVRLPGLLVMPWKDAGGRVITPEPSRYQVVHDPVRKSNYIRYFDVVDSLLDGMFRVTDPGYRYVREGRFTIQAVLAIWSEGDGPEYAATVARLVTEWQAADTGGDAMQAQIPGFTWVPADSEHFRVGRTQRIIGGAQHYSGGTNSLPWLSTTSGRNPYDPEAMVSAHLLIKTNPTMEDRGWQMVRFEDTAYTTGGIVNPKTVAIEKEHLAGGVLDDMDYAVMAQTWVDVAAAVKALNLGGIPLTRQAIKGHNEWVGDSRVCPDGISVNRIVAEAAARAALAVDEALVFEVPGIGTFRLGGGFRRFWEANGGLPVFGYPLSNEFAEDGLTVQYFERARFEWRPGANPAGWDVLLGLVGTELLIARERIAELEAA